MLVLVYVGAVMVLFLFVVMMLDINIEELREGFTRYAPLGGVDRGRRGRRDRAASCGRAASGIDVDRRRAAARRRTTATPRSSATLLYTQVRLSVRDRGRAPAGRDRRGDLADHARVARASRCRTSRRRSRCAREDRVRIVKMPSAETADAMITAGACC